MDDTQIDQDENRLDAKRALDREGYLKQPQTPEELSWCEADLMWPEEETAESIQQTGLPK
jgi:hypothetical protein